jgi:DhnA family fructose-bisphosphate aldolase class Ia
MKENTLGISIPADVPHDKQQEYLANYAAITKNTGRLMLFACDQKIEHMNHDFYNEGVHPDAMHPEHLFNIASQGTIGAMATHLGLLSRYGKQYPDVNYLVKLNGKTNLMPMSHQDPLSAQLWTVDDVLTFKKNSNLAIAGVGYTVYLGSMYEEVMLKEAAQIVYQTHQQGLITVLWIYPRGSQIKDDESPDIIAGAAGVGASLGADFVKVKAPKNGAALRIATLAAGNTRVICSGGKIQDPRTFLQEMYDQIYAGGAQGSATGRNIFQRSLPQAIALTRAISAIVFDEKDAESAYHLYSDHK